MCVSGPLCVVVVVAVVVKEVGVSSVNVSPTLPPNLFTETRFENQFIFGQFE